MNRRDLLRFLAAGVPMLSGISSEQLSQFERYLTGGHRRGSGAFDPHQLATVEQLSEIIIPATNTPGARAAGVAAFIDLIVSDWYREEERLAFMAGLKDLDQRSTRTSGKPFIKATPAQQLAVAGAVEVMAGKSPKGATAVFWTRFKSLTVYGYCTSRPGIEDELRTAFMPGSYDGNVLMSSARGAGR